MENYIGVKEIKAIPMNRGGYCFHRGWDIPKDEDPNDEGFLVEYLDGGASNHPAHTNYISWSPKDVFEKAYRQTDGLPFGMAIEAAKKGHKIARKGWNGKNMFVAYMPPLSLPPYNTQEAGPRVNDRTAKYIGKNTPLNSQPYFAMLTARGEWQPGWLANQADMLADDWEIVGQA